MSQNSIIFEKNSRDRIILCDYSRLKVFATAFVASYFLDFIKVSHLKRFSKQYCITVFLILSNLWCSAKKLLPDLQVEIS